MLSAAKHLGRDPSLALRVTGGCSGTVKKICFPYCFGFGSFAAKPKAKEGSFLAALLPQAKQPGAA
jgi:hypothetical protein